MAPVRARLIPSIDALRQLPRTRTLDEAFGAEAVLDALRTEAAALRAELTGTAAGLASGTDTDTDGGADTDTHAGPVRAADMMPASEVAHSPENVEDAAALLLDRVEGRLQRLVRSQLRSTINATGVIVHTNLGRAPLTASALQRVVEIGAGYASLEFDLARGARGRRDVHAEALLRHLTGADAAIVVNNNAAAVLLMLSALAAGREVIISRGELVEIGGGFRVPDVMRQSGAILREVGTTNRTRAADYAAAIADRTALILRVHPSNFVIEGFTARPALAELTALGRQFRIPVAEDLGSGYLEPSRTAADGPGPIPDEPSVQASVRAGADVVSFSGDKLLGGPQAGLIAGRRDLVDAMRRHPLMRALRVDKLTYAALEATLVEHVRGRAASTVPVVRMLSMPVEEIETRARALAAALSSEGDPDHAAAVAGTTATPVVTHRTTMRTDFIEGVSAIGGGSAPGARLPTRLLTVEVPGLSADALLATLRAHDPPVIARIQDDRVVLDLRTVLPDQDAPLAAALRAAADRA